MDFFSSDTLILPEKGDLLISEPYLHDPNFDRTVVLLCEHNEDGTIGFVLNKPATVGLQDVMDDLAQSDASLFVGGPVQQDTLHFVHRMVELENEANYIGNGLFWGGDYERLASMVNTGQVTDEGIRFFVGYSGWSPGQLDQELKDKAWIVYKNASAKLIFDSPATVLWKNVLSSMGGKYKLISNYPTDPRLN